MKIFSVQNPYNIDGGGGGIASCSIEIVNSEIEKLCYMNFCDDSFLSSVIQRSNFPDLFQKIHKNAIFLKIDFNKFPAGYAAMYANDKATKTAYITLIVIRKEYQRKRLGMELMNKCIRLSRNAGMQVLRLEVAKQNIGAIQFYKSCGFEKEEFSSERSFYMRRSL